MDDKITLKIFFIYVSSSTFFNATEEMLPKVCGNLFLCFGIVSSLYSEANIPDGPQGPAGAILKVKPPSR